MIEQTTLKINHQNHLQFIRSPPMSPRSTYTHSPKLFSRKQQLKSIQFRNINRSKKIERDTEDSDICYISPKRKNIFKKEEQLYLETCRNIQHIAQKLKKKYVQRSKFTSPTLLRTADVLFQKMKKNSSEAFLSSGFTNIATAQFNKNSEQLRNLRTQNEALKNKLQRLEINNKELFDQLTSVKNQRRQQIQQKKKQFGQLKNSYQQLKLQHDDLITTMQSITKIQNINDSSMISIGSCLFRQQYSKQQSQQSAQTLNNIQQQNNRIQDLEQYILKLIEKLKYTQIENSILKKKVFAFEQQKDEYNKLKRSHDRAKAKIDVLTRYKQKQQREQRKYQSIFQLSPEKQ